MSQPLVTDSTALRLAKWSGTSPDLWLNGQLALGLYRPINDEKETGKREQIDPFPC
jgi:plasmid maintenance system antidote protein VapI